MNKEQLQQLHDLLTFMLGHEELNYYEVESIFNARSCVKAHIWKLEKEEGVDSE